MSARSHGGKSERRPPARVSPRQLRVGEELRHAVATIFSRGELRDPALAGRSMTVTEVRVSPDLRNATAYVVPFSGLTGGARSPKSGDAELLAGLERSSSFVRGRVAELVQLRFSPRISFAFDESFDAAQRIEETLRLPEVARDLKPREPEDDGTPE